MYAAVKGGGRREGCVVLPARPPLLEVVGLKAHRKVHPHLDPLRPIHCTAH